MELLFGICFFVSAKNQYSGTNLINSKGSSLGPFIMYVQPFQLYCIVPDGQIHQCINVNVTLLRKSIYKKLRTLRAHLGPHLRQKMKVAFHQLLLIGLLEQ